MLKLYKWIWELGYDRGWNDFKSGVKDGHMLDGEFYQVVPTETYNTGNPKQKLYIHLMTKKQALKSSRIRPDIKMPNPKAEDKES